MADSKEFFPDGVTEIDDWFYDTKVPTLSELGKQYVLTDFGIMDDGRIYTNELQALIDSVHSEGGGVIVVPAGTYMTGAVWFKQDVNLYLEKDGILKGSDDTEDYPVCDTRIEGECCKYFPALINIEKCDGTVISGEGTIDGNGLRSWKAFRQRRIWNPSCTNKDEQRARLIFISECRNIVVEGLTIQNSQFWTNHLYRSDHIKYLNCRILSPKEPVKAPSTDAIDIDGCTDVLIKGCYMEVNDDAVALKGGKGPDAWELPGNAPNERILIEDCRYGFCFGCLTVGSESIHSKNIILRRTKISESVNLLWLKMRPDTHQEYEYISVEDIEGTTTSFLNINPWTQFFDLKGMEKPEKSSAHHISIKRCDIECVIAYVVSTTHDYYELSDFHLEALNISAKQMGAEEYIRNLS